LAGAWLRRERGEAPFSSTLMLMAVLNEEKGTGLTAEELEHPV